MLIPSNPCFPAVDAVALVTVNGQRLFYMLRVTINKDHGVTGDEAKAMVRRFVKVAGDVNNCAFIYVLPNNDAFDDFVVQAMPKCCNKAVPQYKIALQEQIIMYHQLKKDF